MGAGCSWHRASIALLTIATLSAGLLGLGHHHAGDEHQCPVCQAQQTTIAPGAVDVLAADQPSGELAFVAEEQYADRLTRRLTPPLRGPPTG